MAEAEAAADSQDAAWASFNTPLDKASLLAFCQNVERLLRINPYLEFEKWESCGENLFHFQGRNLSQNPPFAIDLELQMESQADCVRLEYNRGLKSSTTFKIEDASQGSKLTIIEDYEAVHEDERQRRLEEVDKSLVKWAEDLQLYIMRWKRWSWLAPWRWYMQRIWQPMNPASRRITYMLLWISVVEVALIILGVAIYFAEFR